MVKEKFVTTFYWSAATIACAMVADYVVTILIMQNWAGYSPLSTLFTSALIAVPVIYTLVGQRYNLRQARDELASARDTAVEANKAKTLFFSNMSHELRTPLNAIIGFSELLASDAFAAKRVEYAALINGSGKHLLSLVDDLLDLSRIEAGRLELDHELIDVDALLADCLGTMAARAHERQIQTLRTVESGLPLAHADRRALKQILLNLLTNAIKFSAPGGIVEVFARHEASGELAMGVRDHGIGIAEEDRDKVFERFGQARHDIAGIDKGTGLGLPIVRGLVEAHGGRILLESQLGEGTCVTFWLPPERLAPGVPLALAS